MFGRKIISAILKYGLVEDVVVSSDVATTSHSFEEGWVSSSN